MAAARAVRNAKDKMQSGLGLGLETLAAPTRMFSGGRGSREETAAARTQNAESYPSLQEEINTPRDLTGLAFKASPKLTTADIKKMIHDPNIKEFQRRLAGAILVQAVWRGHLQRRSRAHREYKINLKYELQLLKARSDRRGLLMGFCQRARATFSPLPLFLRILFPHPCCAPPRHFQTFVTCSSSPRSSSRKRAAALVLNTSSRRPSRTTSGTSRWMASSSRACRR